MKISLITPPSANIEPLVPVFEAKGVSVLKNSISSDCDFILNTSCASSPQLQNFHRQYQSIPIVNLVLDFYKTVWTAPNPHGYNFDLYKEYMNKSVELWCLSNEVILRMKEENISSPCKIMKIWSRVFDYPQEGIIDKKYILQPMRYYKWDKNFQWLKKACYELKIPLAEPQHRFSEDQFQKVIAECSFIVCEYHEASTGGLTLLEGHRLGKPVVISDSKYMGAKDYLGDRAIYFNDDSYDDFKRVIKETWENTPKLDVEDCRKYVDSLPSKEDMVDNMINRFRVLKNG